MLIPDTCSLLIMGDLLWKMKLKIKFIFDGCYLFRKGQVLFCFFGRCGAGVNRSEKYRVNEIWWHCDVLAAYLYKKRSSFGS